MEKRDKIIVIGLIIVILALVAGLAYMFMGNNLSVSDSSVPQGMQKYDFDSAFTMNVPKDVKFLKTWNVTGLGITKIYYNKENKFCVFYAQSDMIDEVFVENAADTLNSSGKYDVSVDGGLKVFKVLDKKEKFDIGNGEKHFDYRVLKSVKSGYVIISGDNIDSLKQMANSISFNATGGK